MNQEEQAGVPNAARTDLASLAVHLRRTVAESTKSMAVALDGSEAAILAEAAVLGEACNEALAGMLALVAGMKSMADAADNLDRLLGADAERRAAMPRPPSRRLS